MQLKDGNLNEMVEEQKQMLLYSNMTHTGQKKYKNSN